MILSLLFPVALGGAPPERVVCLGGSVTETVFALGEGHRVVGTDLSSLSPPSVEALPRVGYYRAASTEGILSLTPDLVLADAHSGPPELEAQLTAAGVPVVFVPAEPGVAEAVKAVTVVAEALGAQDRGAELVASMRAGLAAVPPEPGPRVMFIYARGGGTLNVSGQGTAADAMLALAGATNAVSGFDGYRPLTAEAAVTAAPEVILMTTRGLAELGGPEAVAALPGVSLTPAGQRGAIVAMDDLLLLGFGPRLGEAVPALHTLLVEAAR
ncbi:MAG: ABC transporter substrate-binding protein [Alphaproteobacteria bacterium]|nr:ABC transporter substrate-binding protein [Alphaproteobacteria bacterium]